MAETVKLYLLQEYISRGVHYKAGETIEVDRDTALFLQRDAPGCFAPVSVGMKLKIEADGEEKEATIEKSFDAPPAHKMVKKPAKKK
jgi:hypothetical protein